MRKFFINQGIIKENIIFITGPDYNHIKNVLRLRPGNNIIINNGSEVEYECRILSFEDDRVSAKITQQVELKNEPTANLTLFQGLPKGDKMDLIIQKAVEIGVKKIVPVITNHVIVKLDEKSAQKKTERWQKISEEAAKQSRRNMVPEVTLPVKFKDALQSLDNYDLKIIFYENEKKVSIRKIFEKITKMPKNIAVFVGPEGGLSDEEIKMAQGIYTASLGPRILRTETAGLVAAAIILYQIGDMD